MKLTRAHIFAHCVLIKDPVLLFSDGVMILDYLAAEAFSTYPLLSIMLGQAMTHVLRCQLLK